MNSVQTWNSKSLLARNNCYNYALDRMDNDFKQPGALAGTSKPWGDNRKIVDCVIADGLRKVRKNAIAPEGWHKVLLMVQSTYGDFHWYRQDLDGMWSHKRGGQVAEGGIEDPIKHAKSIGYGKFRGWFFAPTPS